MTILFTWECGAGLGHLVPMLPLSRELARRGHRVFVASRDVARAGSVFANEPVTLLAAPFKAGAPLRPIALPSTFAHVLHNVGWEQPTELSGIVAAWRAMFELVGPDVIVFDHSPTALLASRGIAARRIVTGIGFYCPPDQSPLPNLRPWQQIASETLVADEANLLQSANRVLEKNKQPTLQHVAQLYSEVDDTFLQTFKELDHYRDRVGNPRYRGVWTAGGGKPPQWPGGSGKRLYAYLKQFPALPHLLIRLKGMGCPTLVFVDGIDEVTRRQFTCETMRFEAQRLDMRAAAAECDVAVLNANHGTAAALLLAGKPMLLLPVFLEQQIFAARVREVGAAVEAPIDKPIEIVAQLDRLLECEDLRDSALRFAQSHRCFDPLQESQEMVEQIERMAGDT